MLQAVRSDKRLYHSPLGLFEFQVEGVVYCYERVDNLVVWETGLGKTHLAMATAAMLFEDDLLDHMIVICEKNKLDPQEWPKDLATFTDLDVVVYAGTPIKRRKLLAVEHQVYIGTYETFRNDIAKIVEVPNRKTRKLVPHFFTEAMKGKRVMIVYDEMTKLGNRKSQVHKHHNLMVQTLRRESDVRVMGLTATPIERSPENFYNLGRILMPDHIGTVAQFERDYVSMRDLFGNARKFKNLSSGETESGVLSFADRMKPLVLRKRKTDADVIEQFPSTMEEFTYIDLDSRHKDFYDVVRDSFDPEDFTLFLALRQIAAHPQSLLQSKGEIAKAVVEHVGEDMIRLIPATKQDRLIEYLQPLVKGQGAQVVVFTFFGPSVIPLLKTAMEQAEISVAINHGHMSDRNRAEQKARFKAGELEVFLTSDAGARGINLPEAQYVIEYEMALTHANRTQRLNRIHRIDSTHPSVTFQSFIARGTIEEGIARLVMERNEWMDKLLDDDDPGENFITADMRRRMIKMAKAR